MLTEKQIAWRACQVRFAIRVSGMSPTKEPPTDFDVEYVVNSVAIPTNSSLVAHVHAWEALKRKFEGEWVLREHGLTATELSR